jgi:hypothetical protein
MKNYAKHESNKQSKEEGRDKENMVHPHCNATGLYSLLPHRNEQTFFKAPLH